VRYNAGQVIVETTTNGTSYTTAGTLTGNFVNGNRLTAMVDAAGLVTVWKTAGAVSNVVGTANTTGFTTTGSVGLSLPSGGRVDDFAGGTVQ
jgi:hypothetical protein